MKERRIEVPTRDGSSEGFLYCPDGDGRWPGVLYLTDIGGIRASNREAAGRLADVGYAVLMPNVFYRTGRTPLQPPLRSLSGDAAKQRLAELSQPLTPEAMEQDAAAYIGFLASQDCVRPGAMGVVGYCFTGKMALHTAAALPDKIAAAASFHGGGLFTDAPTSPHLTLPRIKARLYFAHATNDRSMPEEAIMKLDRALETWGGKYESEVYPDAYHSWTASDSPVYNPPQAERAFQKLTELFAATLSHRDGREEVA
ncbi:MAG: dienelactone hydrolase family protein [Terriglobales bacterium]